MSITWVGWLAVPRLCTMPKTSASAPGRLGSGAGAGLEMRGLAPPATQLGPALGAAL